MGEQQNTHNNDDTTEQESTEYSGAPRLLDETDVDCEAPPLGASNSESEPILAEDIFSPSKLRNQNNNATDRHRRAEVHEATVWQDSSKDDLFSVFVAKINTKL